MKITLEEQFQVVKKQTSNPVQFGSNPGNPTSEVKFTFQSTKLTVTKSTQAFTAICKGIKQCSFFCFFGIFGAVFGLFKALYNLTTLEKLTFCVAPHQQIKIK